MVEQQRRAIIQAAQVGRIGLVAQDLVAEVTRNGELRAEWELIDPILHLVEGGQLCPLILALKAAQRRDLGQRRELVAHQHLSRLPAFIAFAVDADQGSRILRRCINTELGVRDAQRAFTHHMLDAAASSAAAAVPLHEVAFGQLTRLSTLAVAGGLFKHDRAEVMLSQPVARLGWAVPRAVEPDCLDLAFAFLDAVDEVNPRATFIVDTPQRIVLIRIGQSCRVLIRIGARKIHGASVF